MSSQTSSWEKDLVKALAKINEEMNTFYSRLEKVEQHRLESINCHLLSENTPPSPRRGMTQPA